MNEFDMYLSGMSLSQVSKKTKTPISTLRFRFKKAGILRGRSESLRLAAKQGRLGSGNRGKKRVFTEEWKRNISKSKTGLGRGFSKKPSGYIEITVGKNKGRMQHVVVMEEAIGRRLFSYECVHHKNKNRSDNRLDNLELMSRSEHSRLHATENAQSRARNNKGQFI